MSLLKNFTLFFIWMLIILYLSFTPLTNWPQETILQKLYVDKLVHITMYSILSFLLLLGLTRQQKKLPLRYQAIVVAVLFCAAMGATIEFLQPVLTMYRKFEWLDMAANATGAILGYYIFRGVQRKQWLGLRAFKVNT